MNFQYPKFRNRGPQDRLRFGGDRFEPTNQRQCRGPRLRRLRLDSVCRLGRLRRATYEGPRLRELKNGWSPGTLKNKAPLGAGQVLSVLPDMPFNPGPSMRTLPIAGTVAPVGGRRQSISDGGRRANGATKMAQRKKPAVVWSCLPSLYVVAWTTNLIIAVPTAAMYTLQPISMRICNQVIIYSNAKNRPPHHANPPRLRDFRSGLCPAPSLRASEWRLSRPAAPCRRPPPSPRRSPRPTQAKGAIALAWASGRVPASAPPRSAWESCVVQACLVLLPQV
jgi:hypothetical protein